MTKYRVVTCTTVTRHYIVEAETKKDAEWEIIYGEDKPEPIQGSEDEEHVSITVLEEEWNK